MLEADFVIVGSGSAGAAMAYRLSEDGKHSVIVIEYGGTDIGRGAGDDWTGAPSGPVTSNPNPADDYKFKTPQLRMTKVTGPYFHNGFAATIEEAVEFMATGGGTDLSGSGTKAPEIIDRGLTVQELADLTTFVRDALMGTEIK